MKKDRHRVISLYISLYLTYTLWGSDIQINNAYMIYAYGAL